MQVPSAKKGEMRGRQSRFAARLSNEWLRAAVPAELLRSVTAPPVKVVVQIAGLQVAGHADGAMIDLQDDIAAREAGGLGGGIWFNEADVQEIGLGQKAGRRLIAALDHVVARWAG